MAVLACSGLCLCVVLFSWYRPSTFFTHASSLPSECLLMHAPFPKIAAQLESSRQPMKISVKAIFGVYMTFLSRSFDILGPFWTSTAISPHPMVLNSPPSAAVIGLGGMVQKLISLSLKGVKCAVAPLSRNAVTWEQW